MRATGGWAHGRIGSVIARISVAALVAGLVGVAVPAAAAATAFDPIDSTEWSDSAFGQVVTNGSGVWLAVARSNTEPQRIVVRRSTDAGASWATTGMFAGSAGGATRPWIAVDGDRVAVSYIGAWNDTSVNPPLQREAPFFATSQDGGVTWRDAVRVDGSAFEARVAVDDDRFWLAWEHPGGVQLRGVGADGSTVFASRSFAGAVQPHLAAADGLMMLAWLSWPVGGSRTVQVVTARLRQMRASTSVDLPGAWLGGTRMSVAVADGGAHVLVARRGADVPDGGPDQLFVASADALGLLGAPVAVPRPQGLAPGSSDVAADIAAAPGTVVVAQSQGGIVSVSTSSDRGASFSPAVPAAGSGSSGATVVGVGIAAPDVSRPRPRFAWSVAARYVDSSGDGLADPASTPAQVAAGKTLQVQLDACASTPGPGATIAADAYTWVIDGELIADSDCSATIPVADGVATSVRLQVQDSSGATGTVEQTVTPQDHLIVSLGDSVASGEGNIHPSGGWVDKACHRSSLAGPALAARRLEDADPHSSVTFVQLACSGAAVVDTPEVAGVDDDTTGGLLDGYSGVDPTPGERRNGQLVQMADLVGSRSIDAATLSIGANDVRFKNVLMDCGVLPRCDLGAPRIALEDALAGLPDRYSRLAAAMPGLGLPNDRVLITEYFDPTTDSTGLAQMRCASAGGGDLIDDDEARWAQSGVIGDLNLMVRAGAAANGWTYVGGIANRFARHGYCADDNWVMTLPESLASQGGVSGAFHPNNAGQRVYADALYAQLRSTLAESTATTGSGEAAGLGDVMVLAVTGARSDRLLSIPVHTTGGTPSIGPARQVDRVATGSGAVSPAGAPAVDRSAALGAWWQASGEGSYSTSIRVGRLATRPNVSVRTVDIVQAPVDGKRLVAGRDALVQAVIDANVTGPTTVAVQTRVTAYAQDGSATDLVDVTEQVALKPGRNAVLLPKTAVMPDDGTRLTAEVIVDDPPGASPADAFDDRMNTTQDREVSQTRPLKVLVGDAYVGKGSVACNDLRGAAERQVAFARAVLPVDSSGIDVELYCGFKTDIEQSEKGVLEEISWLDELARYLGIDALVAVVPKGWLQQAAGHAVGVSARGRRGIILEASAGSSALAHELSHMYGLAHTQPEGTTTPASGALVSKRLVRAGTDLMAATEQAKPWIAGPTWDALLRRIGGPAQAPIRIDPNGKDVWVRGTVTQLPNGAWVLGEGRLLPADAGAPPTGPTVPGGSGSIDPGDLDDLEMQRLTATPVDGSGDPVGDAEPVPVGPVDPLLAPGATSDPAPLGYGFAVRLPVPTGAVGFRLTWTDPQGTTSLGSLALSTEAPVVTLTAPAAGVHVARGSDLTVSWTATDVDSDEASLTHRVLISGDDGATWQPLADAGTATTVTLPVPQDIGGDRVRVRVVTSDGHRIGEATSAAFSAEADLTQATDRIVGVRTTLTGSYDVSRILTMQPDGSGAAVVPNLPTTNESIPGQVSCDAADPASCRTRYSGPTWSGVGSEIVFASDLLIAAVEGDQQGRNWQGGNRLWSVDADGSNLTRITADGQDTAFWGTDQFGTSLGLGALQCPAVSPDGQRLAFIMDRSSNPDRRASLWTMQRNGGSWSVPTRVFVADDGRPVSLPTGWTSIDTPRLYLNYEVGAATRTSCPVWSPDSTSLAFIATQLAFTELDASSTKRTRFDDSPVVVMAADGSSTRVISPRPAYKQGTGAFINFLFQRDWVMSVAWPAGSDPVVVRGVTDPAVYDINNTTAPKYYGVHLLDPDSSTYTRVTPEPDTTQVERPLIKARVAPGGEVYGAAWSGRCETTGLVQVDRTTGAWELAPADLVDSCGDPAVNSYPFYVDNQFDWGRPTTGGGGAAPALPLIPGADPDEAPDPGSAPVDPDVTEPLPVAADPLGGATDYPAPAAAASAGPIEVPAGQDTVIELRTVAGQPERFMVAEAPPADELVVLPPDAGATPPGPAVTSDAAGRLLVRPAPGFVGTTTFRVAVVDGGAATALVTIVVTGNRPPHAVDDTLLLASGKESSIDPAALLANDSDPDGVDQQLRIASAYGATAGRVTLLADGSLRYAAGAPGSVTFRYVVADRSGGTAEARVTVTVASDAEPPIPRLRTVTLKARILFPYKGTTLTAAQKLKLRAILRTIPAGTRVKATAVGMVRATGATRLDKQRALLRARAVAAYLKAGRIPGPVLVSNSGRSTSSTLVARAVLVTVTYTVRR